MSVTQLSIYNNALLLCGERALSGLTEEREPRRLLDQVWAANGGIITCLEAGQWNFAMRASQVDYDVSVVPPFGYQRAFSRPTDWVLTCGVCTDEFFDVPLTRYIEEAGYWYADLDTIYVRYISSDVAYGLNLSGWPESFREYVEEYFCNRIVRKLSGSQKEKDDSDLRLKKKLLHAKNRAAMAEPTSFPARGSWGLARNRGLGTRGDGGNRGSLIG